MKLRFSDILIPDSLDERMKKVWSVDIYLHPSCAKRFLPSNVCCGFCKSTCSDRNQNTNTMDIVNARNVLKLAEECHDEDVVLMISKGYDKEKDLILHPIYHHIACLLKYLNAENISSAELDKRYVNPVINDLIRNNYCINIAEINQVLSDANPSISFHNNRIKQYIIQEFGNKVAFCKPHKRNESLVIYPSHITTADMVARIHQHDNLKSAAKVLRKDLLNKTDFGLSDKLCDKHDLEESWNKSAMTENIATFLATLFNVRKTDLLLESKSDHIHVNAAAGDEIDDVEENQKFVKKRKLVAKSIFQTFFYAVHNGRKPAPL